MTVGSVPAAGGAGGETLEAAHRALLQDPSIQFDLPVYHDVPPPDWLLWLADAMAWIGPALPYIFWTLLGLLAVYILYLVLRDVVGLTMNWPWQRRAVTQPPTESWQPDDQAARHLLSEAEALAERGDYAAAVHLLLRRSVEDIAARRPDFLLPSLTARDIAEARSLPERARLAFGIMAQIVERALFARQPVGEAGWTQARDAYARFAFAGSWSGA